MGKEKKILICRKSVCYFQSSDRIYRQQVFQIKVIEKVPITVCLDRKSVV